MPPTIGQIREFAQKHWGAKLEILDVGIDWYNFDRSRVEGFLKVFDHEKSSMFVIVVWWDRGTKELTMRKYSRTNDQIKKKL